MNKSLSGSVEEYRELTLRGMILGALITVILLRLTFTSV